MEFMDVDHRSELPSPPAGKRYLDFIGGTREWRCYLVPSNLPRARFMKDHSDLLDLALEPIYSHRGLNIRQDASYALPGFYIASLDEHYPSFDSMDPVLHLRMAFILREARQAMRDVLGVEHIHLHYEEKPDSSSNVHYWLMPVSDPLSGTTTVIMKLDIVEYLSQFRFSENRMEIRRCNAEMISYFATVSLAQRDDRVTHLLAALNEITNSKQ